MQITSNAAVLLREVRRAVDAPETYGVRVYAETSDEKGMTVGLGFSEGPSAGDEVSEQQGLPLFVASELAAPLANAIIDTEQQEGEPALVIRPESRDETAPSKNGSEPPSPS